MATNFAEDVDNEQDPIDEVETEVEDEEEQVEQDDDSEEETDADAEEDDSENEDEAEGEEEQVHFEGDDAKDTEDPRSNSALLKDVRRAYKEEHVENRKLRKQLAEIQAGKQAAPEVQGPGAKPTLEGADWDTEKYETEYAAWVERDRKVQEQAAKKQAAAQEAQQSWNQKLVAYEAARKTIKVSDLEEAEATVADALDVTQRGILIQAIKDPNKQVQVNYALGRNPKRLQEIAKIKDPIDFGIAIHELGKQVKVTSRKAPPMPEKVPRGAAPAMSGDKVLDKLIKEADATGDRSKVIAYRRDKRAASAK